MQILFKGRTTTRKSKCWICHKDIPPGTSHCAADAPEDTRYMWVKVCNECAESCEVKNQGQ